MPKEPYRAAAWVEPFSFSDNERQELQARHGLSLECISSIEMGIEEERAFADILSEEPSALEVGKALNAGADAAVKLLQWLSQVDSKTKSVIRNSNLRRAGKFPSKYASTIQELFDSIELAKANRPETKMGRPLGKLPPRLAIIIADAIEQDGQRVDDNTSGPVCQTLEIALGAIGMRRSKLSDIVSKMLKERGGIK